MTSKTISIADLLERKDEIRNKRNATKKLYIDSIDATIEIKKPSHEVYGDALQMRSSSEADIYVVYECVVSPNLKDPELQKGYGCVEPTDIVSELFEPGEIAAISGHCMDFAGFGRVKAVDDDIKKK